MCSPRISVHWRKVECGRQDRKCTHKKWCIKMTKSKYGSTNPAITLRWINGWADACTIRMTKLIISATIRKVTHRSIFPLQGSINICSSSSCTLVIRHPRQQVSFRIQHFQHQQVQLFEATPLVSPRWLSPSFCPFTPLWRESRQNRLLVVPDCDFGLLQPLPQTWWSTCSHQPL